MGYFENLNLDGYNIQSDGKVRYMNGGLSFVPWMIGTDDPIYQGCLADLLELDWTGYQLYLVGGLLHGWKTTDIDICITGAVQDNLPELMEQAEKLGPFDLYYVKSLEDIRGTGNRIWEFAKYKDRRSPKSERWHGQWKSDGLFWMCEKFPNKDRNYNKEPLALN